MFKKFINALKTNRTARYTLIAIIILMVLLCIPAALIGIPIIVVILFMVIVGFPVIIAVGGIGAAVGIAETAMDNKNAYDDMSRTNAALADLEKERGNLQLKVIILFAAAVLLAIIGATTIGVFGIFIPLIPAVIIYFVYLYPMIKKFDKRFADSVIVAEIDRRFTNASFDSSKGFPKEEMEAIRCRSYDVYSGSEFIEAEQGSTRFRSCEVLFEYEQVDTENDTTRYIRDFFGDLYSISLSKPVSAKVVLADKKFDTCFKSSIVIDSGEFDKNLKVYSDDPEAARKLLTGPAVDEILRFSEAMLVPFCLVFNGDKLYLFVTNEDESFFKVKIAKDFTVAQLKERIEMHLNTMTGILSGLESIANTIK